MFFRIFTAGLAEAAAPAATASPAAASAPIDWAKLANDGLTTTLFGLGGVFLVLFLFFLIIKGMQKIKSE